MYLALVITSRMDKSNDTHYAIVENNLLQNSDKSTLMRRRSSAVLLTSLFETSRDKANQSIPQPQGNCWE